MSAIQANKIVPHHKPTPWVGAIGLIAIAIAIQSFRILTVSAENGETPFLSANDRSRWCTIAALIEDRSFIIDRFLDKRDSRGKTRTWYSIDMVRKPEADGTEHYYSSKPPLLSVLYAAICSPISVALNHRLSDAPLLVGRCLLLVVNGLPLIVLWFAFWKWIHRRLDDPWSRWVLLTMVLFGTFLSTFANTLTNHFPAALCLMASLWSLECLFDQRDRHPIYYCLVGLFAALTAAFELPALAWLCAVIGLISWKLGIANALWSALGAAPVAIAFVAANYLAHGDLQPPYAHREVLGRQLAVMNAPAPLRENLPSLAEIERFVAERKLPIAAPLSLRSARRADTWEIAGGHPQYPEQRTRLAMVPTDKGWSFHRWNDWYDYPKSYWLPENKRGVDLGEPSRAIYAFHVLIGHHGIFSLTPFWFVSLIGAIQSLRKPRSSGNWWLTLTIVAVSLICIAFYLTRPLIDRNYGGVCSGFRWIFWLAPAWLWLSAAGLERLSRSPVTRWLVILSVIASIVSATYPWENPWQHPWPYAWLQSD